VTIIFGQLDSRLVNWSSAGIQSSSLVTTTNIINFQASGGVNDGKTPNDTVMKVLLNSVPESGLIIFFDEGTYLFQESIELPSGTTLRGAGLSAKLIFRLASEDSLIKVRGIGPEEQSISIKKAEKDSLYLGTQTASSEIMADDYLYIRDIDTANITSPWAEGSTGQILQVETVEGMSIRLKSALRREYLKDAMPSLQKLTLVRNVGIESLTIENLTETMSQTSNIRIDYAANCWVKCVESINSNYAHIDVRNSTNLEISGNYLHHGFSYGSGGKAYGVMLHFATGEVLVVNNQFERLRHSMIVQAGANGNVFAYNLSVDPFWNEVGFPDNSAGDMVLHGNYVYANLFEGNVAQNIVIDASHGINGPLNTFYRNRAETYGIVMDPFIVSDKQNFIANEVSNTDSGKGLFLLFGSDHLEIGNNIKGTFTSEPSSETLPPSLFTDTKPEFYSSDQWPPIGYPRAMNSARIKAEANDDLSIKTDCELVSITTSSEIATDDQNVVIYPIPANERFFIDSRSRLAYELITIEGRLVLKGDDANINTSNLREGVYFLVLTNDKGDRFSKKIIILH